ncbi:MAG: Omp28-related outer membrane protein [Chitinophagales bacterium]|nr:Omp28-related outer membrane protein [Chitinophagales bacterium]MCB9031462.1 Omp28-related outer membrane protein [Chitinophagales bacterium]HAE13766.1 hypothetical protein [Bacteroidota bacterium]HQU40905.1 Omp28-related outer membrane protein [Chitinophagales bacterium]
MKNISIAAMLLLGTFAFSSCAKERIEGCTNPYALNYNPKASDENGSCWIPVSTHKILFADFNATWCGPCGDWGAPAFSGAINLTEGFAEPMSIHTSDEMSNPISEEFMMFYGITGIPTLKVWNSENSFSDSTGIAGAVVAELAEEPLAEASALVVMTDMGNSYELGVSFTPFETIVGDYFVAVYIMQDGLNFPQNGAGEDGAYDPDFIHNHVLLGSASNTMFGEQFVYGNGFAGQLVTKVYSVPKEASWVEENMYALGVVWKYSKDKTTGEFIYEVVNVTSSRDIVNTGASTL